MTGGAAAALTGLILVAVSLHLKAILGHPLYRDRAFTSLQGLVTLLVVSAIVLTPQSLTAAGIELLLLGVYWLLRYLWFIRLFRGVHPLGRSAGGAARAGLWVAEFILWFALILTLSLSGVLLVAAEPYAFYVLALYSASSFVLIVWNAWVLMAEVAE